MLMDASGSEGLAALVRECALSGVARRALLLRTDLLPPALSRPHHLRLVRAALDPLTLADRARRHELPGGRIAISWRGESSALLQQAIAGLGALLRDLPPDAPGLPQVLALFDLPADGAALLHEAEASVALPPQPSIPEPAAPSPPPEEIPPLDAAALERVEQSFASADMSRFARWRPICRLGPDGMDLAWEERFFSVPELIATAAPGHHPRAERWLTRRLNRLLDRRMLAFLNDRDALRGAQSFSFTLSVASVLSPEFLRFDASLPPTLRDGVIIDLLPADILSDAAAFVFARDFARARSYRLGLRSVTASMLSFLDLPAMELDFVHLQWSPEIGALSCLPHAGSARYVLADAGRPEAVRWGEQAGIALFGCKPTR